MSERSYQQGGCAIAAALEVIGDRWTLLIVRELMGGQRRFSHLLGALPGIAPNLLSSRLKQLTNSGIVEREYFRELPPRTEYHLTETGLALRPILFELLRWGHNHVAPPPDSSTALRRWLTTTLPLVCRPVGFAEPARIGLGVDGDAEWVIEVREGGVAVSNGAAVPGDVTLRADHSTLSALLERRVTLESAAGTGAVRLEGDRSTAERFLALLPQI